MVSVFFAHVFLLANIWVLLIVSTDAIYAFFQSAAFLFLAARANTNWPWSVPFRVLYAMTFILAASRVLNLFEGVLPAF